MAAQGLDQGLTLPEVAMALNDCLRQATAVLWLVVPKLRRESAHARTFDGNFELKIMRMRADSRRNFWTTNQKTAVHN